MNIIHYSGEKDGDIKEYLIEARTRGMVFATFKGYRPFKQLWDLGVITPQITTVRLRFDCRGDGSYVVVDEGHLEGMVINVHAGDEGLHNTKELLTDTESEYWEISSLHPSAFR